MDKATYFMVLCFSCISIATADLSEERFPDDFLFGVASSAHQIEGAWNISGKGPNIWDFWTHNRPGFILDGSNADIACDSYNNPQKDVDLLVNLNVDFYRFSISWSRILPTGFSNKVNVEGVNYYKSLIRELKNNKIIPVVTMCHFDLPKPLYVMGGWLNDQIIKRFRDYAQILFEHFGDSVEYWLTIHDPLNTCTRGDWINGIGDYLCMHNLLKAHAAVYHLYKSKNYKGKVSIDLHSHWYEPFVPEEDQPSSNEEATNRALQFNFGWFANPIYSKDGDYPDMMKKLVAERSSKEGFRNSRLPQFSKEEIDRIKGTSDFFALTHFTTFRAEQKDEPIGIPSRIKDARMRLTQDPAAPLGACESMRVVPEGLREILKWIKDTYGNELPIFIAGNGYSDNGEKYDTDRIDYHELYLSSLLDAIHVDKVNVKAYSVWSLMDSFQWDDGYSHRFGLYHVDFENLNRTRTPKASVNVYKNIIRNKILHSTAALYNKHEIN